MRLTKKRIAAGWTKDKKGNIIAPSGGKATKSMLSVPETVKQVLKADNKHETDEQIRAKLTDAFQTMDKISVAAINGVSKSFIISGAPGLGKSYGVMLKATEGEKYGRKIAVVKGFVRATGLYKILYEYRSKNSVVIFDDADSVFWDMDALNLLKAACDMTRVRNLSWLAETNMKANDNEEEKVPTKFEFEGSIVFLTNMNFDELIAKGNKLSVHFEAMISRSIYLRLPIETRRDYMMRIKMVIEEGMLKDHGLTEFDAQELITFVDKNVDNLRELSLRMIIKIANLMRMDRNDWQKLARATCFAVKSHG